MLLGNRRAIPWFTLRTFPDRCVRPVTQVRKHVAISVLLVAFLALLAIANIPGNPLHKVDDPALSALGARQVWSVFAPDPSQVVGRVSVRFTYQDGSTSTWTVPRGGALVHGYRDYRWLKLAENVARAQQAAAGLLVWAARNKAEDKPLRQADLIRDVYDVAPPGKPRSRHGPTDHGAILSLRAGR
jgi:hypothetical protein